MAKEYTELQLKAKEAGIASWHVKSDEALTAELNGEAPAVKKPVAPVPVAKKPVAKPAPTAPAQKVTFFWKENRNVEFSIVVKEATKDLARESQFFASVGSVMLLDPTNPIELKAIEKLRNGDGFNREYAEVDHRNVNPSQKGMKLDELMALDHKVLAQMIGGSVQDFRKSKGELITELM